MVEASTQPLDRDLPPGTRIGRYELRDVVGRGAMGVVYRAHDIELDRTVALKVLVPRDIAVDEARGRLRRESQAMAKLGRSPAFC